MTTATSRLSRVIPTCRRERVLVETVQRLLALVPAPDEIIVVDQTPRHEPETETGLGALEQAGRIRRNSCDCMRCLTLCAA